MPAAAGTDLFRRQTPLLPPPDAVVSSDCLQAAGPDPQYPQDPVEFAQRVLGVSLWERQQEVLRAVADSRRVAVKSGNGLGKDFTAAVAMLWYLSAHDPAIVLSTAPTFRQVRHLLWRQVRALYRRAADRLGGKMLDTRWELADDRYALGLSADGADQFQGFHCANMFIVVDEAAGVSDTIFEAVETLMTSAQPKLLLLGNPTRAQGAFHRAFHQESSIYHTITMSALESPNVAAGRVIVPGLTTAEWVAERQAIWGEDSRLYRARVLGEFPEQDEDSLLTIAQIEAAAGGAPLPTPAAESESGAESESASLSPLAAYLAQAVPALGPPPAVTSPVVIAVDVARYGISSSVILVRRGNSVADLQVFNQMNTVVLEGKIANATRRWMPDALILDGGGIGGPVVDQIREQGIAVHEFNGASTPLWNDKIYANRRAEGYAALQGRFQKGDIRIPRDPGLMQELSTLRLTTDRWGRMLMESKVDLRLRGQRSPDKADALMMAFADAPLPPP